MIPLRLLRVALEAEALRLGQQARRTVIRVVLGYFALVLMFGAVAFLHVAAWFWLRTMLPAQTAGLIFAGADLVAGLILMALALRSAPGIVEREALAVRRQALEDAAGSLSVSAMLIQLFGRLFLSRGRE